MATPRWAFKFTLTDFDPVLARGPAVITDGTDLFWMDTSTSVTDSSLYKYDVSANTSAKLVDQTNFYMGTNGSDRDINVPSIIFFSGSIYVGVFFEDFAGIPITNSSPFARVYRVDPTSGAITTVISSFPKTTMQQFDTTCWDTLRLNLYSTENVIVALMTERKSGGAPGGCGDPEIIGQHSIDGGIWLNSTISVSDVIRSEDVQSQGRDFRTLGICDVYGLNVGGDFVVLRFSNGTWSKLVGPSASLALFEVGEVHFWTMDDFTEFTDDFVTFFTPSLGISEGPPNVGLNMPFATIYSSAPINKTLRLDQNDFTQNLDIWARLAVGELYTGGANAISTLIRLNSGTVLMTSLTDNASATNWSVYELDTALPPTPGAWGGGGNSDPAGLPRPASIDADGANIYIGLLADTGAPFLLKQETSLTNNAEVVFNASGTDIGVQCGRFDADVVWIAGDFIGTDVVEKSEDAGATFVVKDDGTFGVVEAFAVGPDSDDRVLIADDNVNIEETIDSGANWTNINTTTGFNVNTIARLDINIEEVVFGNDAGVSDNIDYSINSGGDMEDFTTGDFPTIDDVLSVIVN